MITRAMPMIITIPINLKEAIGGYLSYQKAFIHAFVVFATYGAISTVFNILLYTVIDTELPQKLTEVILASTEELLRNLGTPEGAIDEAVSNARAEAANQFTPLGLVWGLAKSMIGFAVISAITALFVRKTEPVEM